MNRVFRRRLTLSHRLLVVLGVVSFLYWCVMAALSTRDNIREVDTLYDVHLAHTAKAFLFLMDPDDNALQSSPTVMAPAAIEQLLNTWPDLAMRPNLTAPTGEPDAAAPIQAAKPAADDLGAAYSSSLRYQLWRDDGSLLFRSDNAPTTAMALTLGYADTMDERGMGWRSYAVHDVNHHIKIIISEPRTFRNQISRSMIFSAATPLGLGLPVLFLLLWFSIRRGLLPLEALSRDIAQRAPGNLNPLDVHSAPDEVQPIVFALNGLLERVAQTLDNERRFSDDAAHQLRTPLAVIQSQLYNARHTQNIETRQMALDKLQGSVARAVRLVNQLLALARLDPKHAHPVFDHVNLVELTETVCADLALLAMDRGQTLELRAEAGLPAVMGNPDLLSMLISNLVDNAIHHTQTGGTIHILLQPGTLGVSLSVCDNGPGIAAEERDKVLERFYRLANQNQPGTGLGLAICKRIAELHQSTLKLSDGLQGHGLCVQLDLATYQPSENGPALHEH
jgi:two-component system sensor histidine kinase QseC